MPKLKNIITFVIIAGVVFALYIVFVKKDDAPEQSLVTTSSGGLPGINEDASAAPAGTVAVADNFLTLLLNVKNIRLEDSVLKDPAFKNLRDTSIVLTHDGSEGRVNPFAKLGGDSLAPVSPPPAAGTPPPASSGAGTAGSDVAADNSEGLEDFLDDLNL